MPPEASQRPSDAHGQALVAKAEVQGADGPDLPPPRAPELHALASEGPDLSLPSRGIYRQPKRSRYNDGPLVEAARCLFPSRTGTFEADAGLQRADVPLRGPSHTTRLDYARIVIEPAGNEFEAKSSRGAPRARSAAKQVRGRNTVYPGTRFCLNSNAF